MAYLSNKNRQCCLYKNRHWFGRPFTKKIGSVLARQKIGSKNRQPLSARTSASRSSAPKIGSVLQQKTGSGLADPYQRSAVCWHETKIGNNNQREFLAPNSEHFSMGRGRPANSVPLTARPPEQKIGSDLAYPSTISAMFSFPALHKIAMVWLTLQTRNRQRFGTPYTQDGSVCSRSQEGKAQRGQGAKRSRGQSANGPRNQSPTGQWS